MIEIDENVLDCYLNHCERGLSKQMVVVPSPGSIWDYPYLDQVASIMGSVYETGPDPEDFFPNKNRIPVANMEGPAFQSTKSESHRAGDTELEELKVIVPTSTVATSTPVQPGNIPCQNGGCKSSRSRGEPRPESPWHLLKTIFLVSVIVALIVWIIVYTLLAQYRVL